MDRWRVGVAPFLSWLRALNAPPAHQVDFYYTADGAPAFAEEIHEIAARYPAVRAHLIDTTVEGRLTLDRILADIDGSRRRLSVFMCGPAGMVNSFQVGFRNAGVPARHVHREYFDWR